MSFIRRKIAEDNGIDRKYLYITECDYYRGRYRAADAKAKHLLFDEREFEDMLIEKGVDTWFALDTYQLTLFRNFDFVVLISGDADHEMLARKLKALKTHVILLTWDPANTASTSRFLKEEVCTHIDMNLLISNDKTLLQTLTI